MSKDIVTCAVPYGGALFLNNMIPHRRYGYERKLWKSGNVIGMYICNLIVILYATRCEGGRSPSPI